MSRLPWPAAAPGRPDAAPPRHDPAELIGVVPADPRTPYDCREILARVVDGSEFLDFKAAYDTQTICGHASICGHRVGIVGNNGPITPKGADKAAHFVQLCDQSGLPLVFLHNTTGFMVGTEAEGAGIVKRGSRLIQAVTNARVPRIAVQVGGSYGAGNYAMCGRGLDPRFVFAWPNARTAVMGGAQAGMVLRIVAEAKARRAGAETDPDTLDALERDTAERLDAGSTALFGTARLWDDGLIDPRDTRAVLAFALDTCADADRASPRPNTFGVARF
jgi:geranyl-CoA carboxylase beta subunit